MCENKNLGSRWAGEPSKGAGGGPGQTTDPSGNAKLPRKWSQQSGYFGWSRRLNDRRLNGEELVSSVSGCVCVNLYPQCLLFFAQPGRHAVLSDVIYSRTPGTDCAGITGWKGRTFQESIFADFLPRFCVPVPRFPRPSGHRSFPSPRGKRQLFVGEIYIYKNGSIDSG